ncbi:MAG: hypothetical protein WBC63_07545 [Candidatus Bipolaricaulia bacterium]
MKWSTQNADEFVCDEGGFSIKCAGCSKALQGSDVCYVAHSLTETEADGIREMFDVDPFGGSVAAGDAPLFCSDCLLGFSDDPEAWFRERMRIHEARKSVDPG